MARQQPLAAPKEDADFQRWFNAEKAARVIDRTDGPIRWATRMAALTGKPVVVSGGERGLRMRIGKTGSCVWFLETTKPGGAVTSTTLGEYPALTIATAREQAKDALKNHRFGLPAGA